MNRISSRTSRRGRVSLSHVAIAAALLTAATIVGCSMLPGRVKSYPPRPRASGIVVQEMVIPDNPEAAPGQRVAVHYEARVRGGALLDSTVERGQPLEFVLGDGSAPPALDEGVQGMRLFGRRRIIAPPSMVFPGALPDGVDEEDRIELDLELVSID